MESDSEVSDEGDMLEKDEEFDTKSSKGYGSRTKAINQHCKDCIYDVSNGGNWRQQVTACTVVKCALYTFRPISRQHTKESSDAC